jgi:UPF0755 protein
MARRFIIGSLIASTALLSATLWVVFRPVTNFSEDKKVIYLYSGKATLDELSGILKDSQIIYKNTPLRFFAGIMQLEKKLKPGKYVIGKGMSLKDILSMLRRNEQEPVRLVIIKFRTPEQFASFIGKRMECDSAAMLRVLRDPALLKELRIDSNTWMTAVIPNTYEFYWTTPPEQVLRKLWAEQKRFWTEDRLAKAAAKQLSPQEIYTLASILDEETNANAEKDTMASVYLNRLRNKIPLQADPTVKFALKDFGLRRIYHVHLETTSLYNTYKYPGLPPGPICTPSIASLEAVLNAPETEYLYFVARSDFSGRHVFSKTYSEHRQNAKLYQRALNEQQRIRAEREKARENNE